LSRGSHIGKGCVLTHGMMQGLYLDTRIGRRVIVSPEVTIGRDCVIGAGWLDVLVGSRAADN
jgi:UDP-3-O-[3-hydroxymyristoyl] glucosamine N-acyltransferase